jgi:predicted nuclease with RNAse H fold
MSGAAMWAGVDVGGSRKGFHVALLDDGLSVSLDRASTVARCVELVRAAAVVGIDAPAAWAAHGEGSRADERAFLAARVCGIRPTPDAATAGARTDRYYEWVERGLELWAALRAAGVHAVECFPTASWTRWVGPRGGAGRGAWSRAGLAALGLDGAPPANQDERDAVAAALTAWQCDRQPASVERFGDLVVPRPGLPVRDR